MSALPPELRRAIDELVRRAGLSAEDARRVRADLEAHFRDGLAAGRTPDELLEKFGSPEAVAPVLAEAAPPRRSRPGPAETLRDAAADARVLVRGFRRAPVLAAASVVALALGIAANLVASAVANALVLRPLPVDDPATLVDVWPDVEGGNSFAGFSALDLQAFRDGAPSLETLSGFAGLRVALGEPESGRPIVAQVVSSGYFPMLGLRPSLGRLDLPDDGEAAPEPVAILSHGLWRSAFGAGRDVIGRTVRLDGHAVRVVGVAPAGFEGHFIGFPVDAWLPLASAERFLPDFDPDDPASKPLEMIGRLRPGAQPSDARAELSAVAERLAAAFPETHRGHGVGVTRTTGLDHSLGAGARLFVLLLVAVAVMVLVVACLNVGGMLLIRTVAREQELAVRTALGAGRVRLARQLLAESAVLVAAATGFGLLLGTRATAWLERTLPALSGGLGIDLSLDWRVVALTCAVAALAVVLAGAAPALHLLRRDPAGVLRSGAGIAARGATARGVLVVAQVAGSVTLATLTGLFARAVLDGERIRPGFDPDRVASFALRLDEDVVGTAPVDAVVRATLAAIASVPGVDGVTVADQPVLGWIRTPAELGVAGALPPPGRDVLTVDVRRVGAAYLSTAGIGLLSGREIEDADRGDEAPVAVVSRAFVERWLPDGEALGRSIEVDGSPTRVVGVAEDARYVVQDPEPDPLVYLPLAGTSPERATVIVSATRPEQVANGLRQALDGVLPAHPVPEPRTARQVLRDALFPQRIAALLIGTMGLTALVLAALGLYALVRFSVARDARALGIRLALGSGRRRVWRRVLGTGALPVALGTALGLGAAAAVAPLLGRLLPGVSPFDAAVYATVGATLAVVAVAASAAPAARATAIDPAEVLRES